MRPALAGLFTLALGATVLAGDGLVLVPHGHGFGEQADHSHGLALYRFPIALLGPPPGAASPSDRGSAPSFRLARPLAETLLGASLILVGGLTLIVAAARQARATRADATMPGLLSQWWTPTPTRPPRTPTLSSA